MHSTVCELRQMCIYSIHFVFLSSIIKFYYFTFVAIILSFPPSPFPFKTSCITTFVLFQIYGLFSFIVITCTNLYILKILYISKYNLFSLHCILACIFRAYHLVLNNQVMCSSMMKTI